MISDREINRILSKKHTKYAAIMRTKSKPLNNFTINLRRLIALNGWNLSEFEKKCNKEGQGLYRVLIGETFPSLPTLLLILDVLKVRLEDLLSDAPPTLPEPEISLSQGSTP